MPYKKLFTALVVMAVAFSTQTAGAGYVAYSVSKKGNRTPLPERIEELDKKHLINIEWGEYSGRKARLGVLPVDNTSTSRSFTVTSSMGDVDYSTSSTGIPVKANKVAAPREFAEKWKKPK